MKLPRPFSIGIMTGLLITGVIGYFFLLVPIQKQEEGIKRTLHQQIKLQSAIIDSLRQIHLAGWMGSLLTMVHDDLNQLPSGTLDNKTIAQIAAFCYSAHPYPSVTGDSLTEKLLSPERGQILMVISKLELDTNTLRRIFKEATFSYSDLRGADLRDAYLPGVDLQYADLQGAHLQHADPREAKLDFANLWGAHMAGIDLQGADLKRADLQWSDINSGNLSGALLSGANLKAAQARKANLNDVVMQWASAEDAFFNDAQFVSADLTGTSFRNAHLNGAVLDSSILAEANLVDTRLNNCSLAGANMLVALVASPMWFDQLKTWNVSGFDSLPFQYQIEEREYGGQIFLRLEPKKQK